MARRLLLLNGLAVIGAVVYHATGWGFTALFWWTDRYQQVTVPDFSQLGGAAYYSLRVLEQLVTPSVPAFLFVSGYFVAFAVGREQRLAWSKVGGRIKMLLIPYVLWSLAIFVERSLEGRTDTAIGYVQQLLLGRAAQPYYYIPLLIQLYLLSPFVVPHLRRHWKPWLIAAGLLQLTVQAAHYPVLLGADVPLASWIVRHTASCFFPNMVFWFVFGAAAGFHVSSLREWVSRWKRVLPVCTVVLGLLGILEWELLLRFSGRPWLGPTPTALDSLFSGAAILTFVAYAQARVPLAAPLNALGERSFGVYLAHAPVLELLSRGLYHLAPMLLGSQVLFQTLLVAGGIGVPLLLMATVNRSPARASYNYLFG